MKKLLFVLAIAVSCTEIALNNESDLASLPEQKSGTLTIEEALKELSNFNESLYSNTVVKSSDRIAEIAVCKIPPTKSTDSEEILAYVMNYEDNKGFAVINADPLSIPIVARTESGHLDPKRLNGKILDLIGGCQTKSSNSEDDIVDNSSPEEFVYEMIANSVAATTQNTDNTRATYGNWNTVFKYGPLVTVKWNQTYPFNMRMEPDSNWTTKSYSYYRGLPPVGCSNVALGQILATIEQPEESSYSWGTLRSLSNYLNVSNYLPRQSSYPFETNPLWMSKLDQLAEFLYSLSELSGSKSDKNGTTTYVSNALKAMKSLNSTYFAEAEILEYQTNSTLLIDCVKEGKPIYFYGYRIKSEETTKSTDDSNSTKVGHMWVVDGYTKRERTITTTHPSGGEWTGTQLGFFFHINWGYSGQYDGYYNTGVFDMSLREDYDTVIDTYPNTTNGTKSYPLGLKFIKY